jgi:hypothetical protein
VTLLRAVIFLLPLLLLPAGAHAASTGNSPGRVVAPSAAQPIRKTAPQAKASAAARPGTTRPAPAPQDDQSYLFATDPRSGKGPPDYVTSGSKHSNQPWFMTIYDTVGDWR